MVLLGALALDTFVGVTIDNIANAGSLVLGNTARANTGFGLRLQSGVGYAQNVISGNLSGRVTGGADLGHNLSAQ